MISVLTGDIVNSRRTQPQKWLEPLKRELQKQGPSQRSWEIYRGDSFQLIVREPKDALTVAIKLKASIKSLGKLDIRIAIGIAEKGYDAKSITESNGPAFVHSGDEFEKLRKRKQRLAVKTNWPNFDEEINLYFRLGLIAMDAWTTNEATAVQLALEYPDASQEDLGRKIGIKQNAVSTRLKRAYFSEIVAMDEMYKTKLRGLL